MAAILLSSARPQRFVLEVEASEDSIRLRMRLSTKREPCEAVACDWIDPTSTLAWAEFCTRQSSTVNPELSFGIQSNQQQFWALA